MALTTRTQLEANARRVTESLQKSASALSAASNLFLSHSSLDKGALVNGAIAVLHDNGASVYADILDPAIRQLSPEKFGAFFAEAIADTGRLVALVTSQTSTSRWVPWELGLAHGMRSAKRVAVWPVMMNLVENDTWARQEYFEMYPRIEWVTLSGRLQWGVRDPGDGRYWRLSEWLTL